MKTQNQIIKEKLLKDGKVTTPWAIQRYIIRLGAIVYRLKQAGYNIVTGKQIGRAHV